MIARQDGWTGHLLRTPLARRLGALSARSCAGLALIGWAVVVTYLARLPGQRGLTADPLRLLIVGGFLLVGPGLAVVGLLRLTDRLLSWVTATGASLAVLTLGAQTALHFHIWSPTGVVRVIAAGTATLALAGVITDQWRARTRRAGSPEEGDTDGRS